jgi:hypothetical protein
MNEFRGHLYIFVDRGQDDVSGLPVTTFDEVFGLCEPGHLRWYLSGWAVSKNSQGQYCSRTSLSKARRFSTFAEAMNYARKKRKTRPKECFHLVYELDAQKSVVTSLEQIVRIDGGLASSEHLHAAPEDDPVLEQIAARTGRIVATNALALLRIFQREGEDGVRARFSRATHERLWGVLQEAGLVDTEF